MHRDIEVFDEAGVVGDGKTRVPKICLIGLAEGPEPEGLGGLYDPQVGAHRGVDDNGVGDSFDGVGDRQHGDDRPNVAGDGLGDSADHVGWGECASAVVNEHDGIVVGGGDGLDAPPHGVDALAGTVH